MAKDNEGAQNPKRIRSKLGWNDLIKIKDIDHKGVKSKPKTITEEFLIHGQSSSQIGGYSVLQPWDMNMKGTLKSILIMELKDFGLCHWDLGRRANPSHLGLLKCFPRRLSQREETSTSFKLLELLELPSSKDESWDPYNLETLLIKWLKSSDNIFHEEKEKIKRKKENQWKFEGKSFTQK